MDLKKLQEKYADLIVQIGINLQPGQKVMINCNVEHYEFARILVKACYLNNASAVNINYIDLFEDKLAYLHQSIEELLNIPQYKVDRSRYLVDNNYLKISLISPVPKLMIGLNEKKVKTAQKKNQELFKFERDYTMRSTNQYTIAAVPNELWAQEVFPSLSINDALNSLWKAIFQANRIEESNNYILDWKNHTNKLNEYSKKLNDYNFKKLLFKNSLGTNLEIELASNNVWQGGKEKSLNDVLFTANLPTEEVYAMPNKYKVNGHVVGSKPLIYHNTKVEDFSFTFKDGKVVKYDAKKNLKVLKELLSVDEGAMYLGEVALVDNDSPISKMNVLFNMTLFDENASCHLALGQAYQTNIINGSSLMDDELEKMGCNFSKIHVDFMFGSSDMEVIGYTEKEEVIIIQNGNFII